MKISVTVPDTAGIFLPSQGLSPNSSAIKISTNAVAGPVLIPQPFESSPAFGSFDSDGDPTRLAYTPAEFQEDGTPFLEGRIASISLAFALNRVIEAGEEVFFVLKGFSRVGGDAEISDTENYNSTKYDSVGGNISAIDTMGVFSAFQNATWEEANTRLTLKASEQVPAYQHHVVLLQSSAGIRLPTLGMRKNDPRLLIGTNAAAGPNDGTPIQQSPELALVCDATCAVWELRATSCRCR